jgi:hypothetical protein
MGNFVFKSRKVGNQAILGDKTEIQECEILFRVQRGTTNCQGVVSRKKINFKLQHKTWER